EDVERRERIETPLRVSEALASGRQHARHRPIYRPPILIEPLASRCHIRPRRSSFHEPLSRDGPAPTHLERLANARRDPAHESIRRDLTDPRIGYHQLGGGRRRWRAHVCDEIAKR